MNPVCVLRHSMGRWPDGVSEAHASGSQNRLSDDSANPMTENFLEFSHPTWWMEFALCREVGGDLWHPDEGEGQTYMTNRAKAVCSSCPVINECLDYAMDNGEMIGVWGGTTPSERKRLRKEARESA